MSVKGIRILRPSAVSPLVSAAVFDHLLLRHLGSLFQIHLAPFLKWYDSIFGVPNSHAPVRATEVAARLATVTREFDFLCPGFHCFAVTPMLAHLRNLGQAKVRFLLIAHAPGAYLIEWALLRRLLRPGDLVIAPTQSAKEVIEFLCPDLTDYVRVIPHPVHRLSGQDRPKEHRVVSLGRITPEKLLHRQIEAMAVIRDDGSTTLPKLQIVGPLRREGSPEPTAYARSLAAKVRRLRLDGYVELRDRIDGDSAKAALLSGANMLINLSVTIEESFGKAVVEALGLGVPVLATRWDGLPETVGSGGALLPVRVSELDVDVTAQELAEGVQRLLAAPPSPQLCETQAERSCPEQVRQAYARVLEEALDTSARAGAASGSTPDRAASAAPSKGLLSRTAPLEQYSWEELFRLHEIDCARFRSLLGGGALSEPSQGERLRALLLTGTRRPLERFLAGVRDSTADPSRPMEAVQHRENAAVDFTARLADGAASGATVSSRVACLMELRDAAETALLREGVQTATGEGLAGPDISFLAAEAQRQSGNYAAAFRFCVSEEGCWGEHAAHRLRQLARICREWGLPQLALPGLSQWLAEFPDAPDSGAVWLDLCVNAAQSGRRADANAAWERAFELLGNLPVVERVHATFSLSCAAAEPASGNWPSE